MSNNKKGGNSTFTPPGSNLMWGGRFQGSPAEIMTEINASIGFDQRLFAQDIEASKAHAAMLVETGIIEKADGEAIQNGLDQILGEIEAGTFEFKAELEDIHMNVEARLAEIVGPAAGRLHTARSRNDQVATDFKLWVRDAIDGLIDQLGNLQKAVLERAAEHADTLLPGFTHLQVAQPVTLGHHLLAYVEMFERDKGRFFGARKRLNECPLGAAALAGTSFPIDRDLTSKSLEFERPTANSLDAVSDRDFALEALSAASITAIHLSRFAEELVIWSSAQFGFITMSDQFSTGSSIMPQKKNPDAAELIRAKVGRILGAQTTLQTVMKGLPLAYSKDMQEDKEPVFEALDTLALSLGAMTGMVGNLKANQDAMAEAAAHGFSTATDLADWLVREKDIPFREAHHITGAIVAIAEDKKCRLDELSLADLQSADERITKEVFDVLSVVNSVASRTSFGGTAPKNVRTQITYWQEKLK